VSEEKLTYEPIPNLSREEIELTIRKGEPEKVLKAVLSAALFSGDGAWAEKICYRVAEHPSPLVRANVHTALGHIARIHGTMDWNKAVEVLESGLRDQDEFVRSAARDGLDDVKHFRA